MFGSNDSEQSQAESFRDTTGHSSLNHDGMMIGWTDDQVESAIKIMNDE